jgi:DNA mismatch repair protein MutS2
VIRAPFTPGDHVLVASLGKGIVREARRGGRYLVEIKGRSLIVQEDRLSPDETPKSRRAAVVNPEPLASVPRSSRSHSPTSVDLHGMTTNEAVSAVDEFLNDAMLAGHDELRIIHGRGAGRIKSAVHAHLKKIASVRYRLDPRNPGATIVVLK